MAQRSNAIRRSRTASTTAKRKTNWDFYFADGHLGVGITSGGNRLRINIPIGPGPGQQEQNGDLGGFVQEQEQGGLVQSTGGYVNPYCPNGLQSPDATPINIPSGEVEIGGDEQQLGGGEIQAGTAGGDENGDNDNQPSTGEQFLESALAEFQQGRLAAALKFVEQARLQLPENTDLHHFRSLLYFARGDYQQAAAAAHKALTGGPGWDWNTLKQMYPNTATYTGHLRALEKYSDANPNVASARFLLAYHYLTMGTPAHVEAAQTQLKKAVELEPNDAMSQAILKNLEAPESDEPAGE